MSEVLYRKYRPQKFSEVVGQDHIIEALKGSIKAGKVSHAFLFSGSRGTGKTSVARILANELRVSGNDLYEIDAASNTSVEDIRALSESIHTSPFESPYKFYIIDEVHMLSKSAFNAFLKTLEEPPEHVIFVLATTESHKIPDTIISRCEVHNFRKPTEKELVEMISKISKKEGYSIDKSSADLIALLGDGSFRDALGMLQKTISASTDKKLALSEVEKITGAPKISLVQDFIKALAFGNVEAGLEVIGKISDSGTDVKIFTTLVLVALRRILLLRYAPKTGEELEKEISKEAFVFLSKIASDKDAKINSKTLLRLLEAFEQIGRGAITELPLELALLDLTAENKAG